MTLHHEAEAREADGRELSRSDVFDMLLAYKNTAVLTTGIELGIFDAIAAGASTAAEVARYQGLDPRGARLLLNALSSLGLLESDGVTYGLPAGADKLLVRGNPGFVGDMAKVMASAWEWDALRSLPNAVRSGGTVVAQHAETPEYAYWEDFAAYAGAVATPAAELTADMLGAWAAGRERLNVLDMACGHGLYGYTFARRNPNARVWSLDWPNVLPVALARADRMGIADRVHSIAGDMFEADLGGPYDAVMITNVLHHFSRPRAAELLRRAAGVLADDGRIVVVGFTVSDAPPAQDAAAHLFSILMLIWTHEGEVHSLEDYQGMLHDAGFTDPESRNVAGSPLWVITARPTAGFTPRESG
jgi:cyclopropane fatty-acyl-phospholipid synthase-like methyltransferase